VFVVCCQQDRAAQAVNLKREASSVEAFEQLLPGLLLLVPWQPLRQRLQQLQHAVGATGVPLPVYTMPTGSVSLRLSSLLSAYLRYAANSCASFG